MKSRLVLDLAAYIIAPIIFCKFFGIYSILGLIIVVAYALICKNKEARINLSGLIFAFMCITLAVLKEVSKTDYNMYINETYLLLIASILIGVSNILGKNFVSRIYFDIQRMKHVKSLSILRNIKKYKLSTEFSYLSYTVSLHLLVLGLVKIYSILNLGESGYLTIQNLEVLISLFFSIGELYLVSIIISKSKEQNNRKVKKIKTKDQLNNSRVIELERYKNANK
jgi:hypothetical protein